MVSFIICYALCPPSPSSPIANSFLSKCFRHAFLVCIFIVPIFRVLFSVYVVGSPDPNQTPVQDIVSVTSWWCSDTRPAKVGIVLVHNLVQPRRSIDVNEEFYFILFLKPSGWFSLSFPDWLRLHNIFKPHKIAWMRQNVYIFFPWGPVPLTFSFAASSDA